MEEANLFHWDWENWLGAGWDRGKGHLDPPTRPNCLSSPTKQSLAEGTSSNSAGHPRVGVPNIRGGEIARVARNLFNKTNSPCLGVSTQENLQKIEDTF